MLKDIVAKAEREEQETVTATGACRFCGQVATQKGLKGWSQGDEDG